MSAQLSPDEQRALKKALEEVNEKGWGIGLGLVFATGLFVATNILVLKGGSQIGPHLRLLGVYFPGYTVTFVGSLIGSVYAFVVAYLVGRAVVALYYRLSVWIG